MASLDEKNEPCRRERKGIWNFQFLLTSQVISLIGVHFESQLAATMTRLALARLVANSIPRRVNGTLPRRQFSALVSIEDEFPG
jgi:hypothetical protein